MDAKKLKWCISYSHIKNILVLSLKIVLVHPQKLYFCRIDIVPSLLWFFENNLLLKFESPTIASCPLQLIVIYSTSKGPSPPISIHYSTNTQTWYLQECFTTAKKLKMILSTKEKNVCDVLFDTNWLIYQLLVSLENEYFFRSPLCIAQRSRESGVLRGHLFPYFHFHPSSSICDISLAGSHRIFGIIL